MTRASSSLFFFAGVVAVVSAGGCNAITGIGDLTRADTDVTGGDGGPCGGADLTSDAKNCGTCGNACAATSFCSNSSCVPGCTGGTLYVSKTGSDANDGCAQDRPLATIAHALAIGKAQGNALVSEIHVCKGTYAGPGLTLDFKASLRGAYDCGTWARTATFGAPTFDGTNATEIDDSDTSNVEHDTLFVTGAAVDASVTVDGFRIVGAGGAAPSVAVAIAGGAKPILENDDIAGGAPSEGTSPIASLGVLVRAGGAPEIRASRIAGGAGVSTSTASSAAGSVGVEIAADADAVSLHDDTIAGGSGSAPTGGGSVGLLVLGGKPVPMSALAITGGSGKVTTSGGVSTAVSAVVPSGVTLEIDRSTIDGGTGSCAGASGVCQIAGVAAAGAGSLTLRADRIYGGDATGSTSAGSVGVSVSGLASFVAENDMIHGGNKGAATSHGAARAIEMTQTTGPVLQANTLYAGTPGSSSTSAGISIAPNVSGIVAKNNLVVTSGVRDGGLVVVCSPSLVTAFQNNVFLTESNVLVYGGGSSGTCPGGNVTSTYPTMAGTESFLAASSSGATISGNMLAASSCTGDASCTVRAECTSAAACAAAVIAGWSATDTGYATLVGAGWKVNPLCVVSHGGLDLSPGLTTDLYGTTRTAPFSSGAHEQDGACN